MCGSCGKRKATAKTYVWTSSDGKQVKEFATRADALYQRDQSGNGSVTTKSA